MTTNPTRCDQIIRLIDACLAEFGSPIESVPAEATSDGPTSRQDHR